MIHFIRCVIAFQPVVSCDYLWFAEHYILVTRAALSHNIIYVAVTLSFLKSMQQNFTKHPIIHAARDNCDWFEDKQTSQSCLTLNPQQPNLCPVPTQGGGGLTTRGTRQ